jgi:hypothetical protein
MGQETLIVGYLTFKKDISVIAKQELRETLEKICEGEFRYDGNSYKIQSINWTSHIDETQISLFFDEHKTKLKDYSLKLFYLDEPDVKWASH